MEKVLSKQPPYIREIYVYLPAHEKQNVIHTAGGFLIDIANDIDQIAAQNTGDPNTRERLHPPMLPCLPKSLVKISERL